MEADKYPYQKQWEDYGRRQLIFWLVFAAFIPYMILVNGATAGILKSFVSADDIMVFSFIFFAAVWMICGIRLQYWKCPQCGNAFHSKWWRHNIFSNKCLHCKLPKYANSTFYNDRLWKADR